MSEENTKNQENNNDWKNREMGALWRREGKNQNYLSGHVKVGEFGVETNVKLVVFTNKYKKENPKAPDFIVYQADEVGQSAASTSSPENAKSVESVESVESVKESTSDIPDMLEA
jgi:hypothetical protein